jgi:Tol biopolymer transport system component/DNA-binding winged helix-turn-helix (wHTH) protein
VQESLSCERIPQVSRLVVGTMATTSTTRQFRFATFEVDVQTGELRKGGVRIRLQEQPFKVLVMLLERPGELVTRNELKQRLWTESEFGDFDQGINVAIKKLRTALGDASDNPRFIETLSRRGYRFIAPVNAVNGETTSSTAPVAVQNEPQPAHSKVPRWALIAGGLIVLVAIAGLFLWRRPHQYSLGVFSTQPDFRLTPLTSSLGYEFDPQFSPDGKQIVYAWSDAEKGRPDIYLKVLGAGSPVRLLAPQNNVVHVLPTWSPDGRFIACLRVTKADEPPLPDSKTSVAQRLLRDREQRPPEMGVYLVPAVGGEEKKLFNVAFVSDLKWSPDGNWLLLGMRENRDSPVSLYRFSLDGTEKKRLTTPPANFAGDTIPSFSPDGKYIAFSRNISSGGSDIFLMSANGGEPKRITYDAHHLRGLSFTADGQELVYSSARQAGARRSLWRIPIKGGTPTRLPFGTDNADAPTVSLTGNHLAYVQANESTKIWAYPIPSTGEIPRDPALLIGSRQLQVGPQYSPDGKRIVFTSDRTGSWEIWVSTADGTNAMQLTSFGDRQTGTPRWSPDGKLIAFDSRPEKRSDIYVMDSAGGKPHPITVGPFDNVVPSFSRDGKWVYFSSNSSGGWELWKVALNGSDKPIRVTHNGGFSAFESFDGQILFYSKWDKPGIFSMPVQGGEETMVTGDLIPHLWGAWAVVPDGLYLITPQQEQDTKELYPALSFYQFATKNLKVIRRLDTTPNVGPSVAISPDGKTLLYVQPDKGGTDIMIVDNFR